MGIAADFVLIIVAGLLGGVLARAARLPLLVGYIAAGVFVGPNTAGPTVGQIHDIELLAEIGVALLLFALGLEISFGDLKPVRRIAIWGGPLQILLTGALGAFCGVQLLTIPVREAVWLGAMVSLSSTMVVLKMLAASGTMATLASRVMIGLLVIQDLAVVPMLIVLPKLGKLEGVVSETLRAVLVAAVFLAAIFVVGTRLLPALLTRLIAWGSRELFLIAVVAAGVGVGYASHAVGLSFALGAFVAGIVLSESDLSHQALSDVVPLRDVFGLLFFVSVGMLFDPRYLFDHPREVLGMSAIIVLGKATLTGAVARAFGYGNMAPWIVGLGLAQIGEFSFVLARAGRGMGALSEGTYNLALSCTILTMAISPLTLALALPAGRRWRAWWKRSRQLATIELPAESLAGHVIVAGWGRAGRVVARVVRQAGMPLRIIEIDHSLFRAAEQEGIAGVWGDVTRPEILEAAGGRTASIVVLAVPDIHAVILAARAARAMNPGAVLVARAPREDHVAVLRSAGIDAIIQPEFEGGIAMVREVLERSRCEPDAAASFVDGARTELYRPNGGVL